ncbi:lytic transglycosylase domain-containing protein [Mesorhizobium sp. CAU 1741]|uniref:lytic transglycosylase domain-containing protein n=1 Tax=Mesorhizobium sp. CAU 1741 TaxID=3140366 RepID=UPI00325BD69C
MPRLRPDIALSALLAAGMLSACSTSSAGLGEQLALAAEQEAADPALPDTVSIMPSPSGIEAKAAALAAITPSAYAGSTPSDPAALAISSGTKVAARSPELDALIARYAAHHEIPESLLRRVVNRESTFNPAARNGPYWGLMQILPATARTMGYRGSPEGLLDAETNLMYAGKYLRGAYMTADGNHDLAVRFYSRGYYYDAKRKGLLEATGLRPSRTRMASGSL